MSALCITYQWDRLTAIFIVKTFMFNFFNTDPFLFFPKQKQTCLVRCVQIAKVLTGLQLSAGGRFSKICLCWTPDKGQLTSEGGCAWAPCCHLSLAKSSLHWGVMFPVFPFNHIVQWLMLIYLFLVHGEGYIYIDIHVWAAWIFNLKSSLCALSKVNAKKGDSQLFLPFYTIPNLNCHMNIQNNPANEQVWKNSAFNTSLI